MHTDAYPLLQDSDGYSYFTWAKDIASGDFLGSKTFTKWPLYAYFLGAMFKFFGSNISLVYAIQFVLGSVNSVLIYLISGILFKSRRVGFIAALLNILYGLYIFYEGLLIYTNLSLFLNLLLFLFLLLIKNNLSRMRIFGLGLFLGVCTILQANIIIFGISGRAKRN
jgi:4-amino-4-deoxy-L-arabinose transferase-like glycosyltransferase